MFGLGDRIGQSCGQSHARQIERLTGFARYQTSRSRVGNPGSSVDFPTGRVCSGGWEQPDNLVSRQRRGTVEFWRLSRQSTTIMSYMTTRCKHSISNVSRTYAKMGLARLRSRPPHLARSGPDGATRSTAVKFASKTCLPVDSLCRRDAAQLSGRLRLLVPWVRTRRKRYQAASSGRSLNNRPGKRFSINSYPQMG